MEEKERGRGCTAAKMTNIEICITPRYAPCDELPLNFAIQSHLDAMLLYSFFTPGGDASLMRLVRAALHSMRRSPSDYIVSLMTLIMPYMHKPRYIMHLIIPSRCKYIIQNNGGYKGTFCSFIKFVRNL